MKDKLIKLYKIVTNSDKAFIRNSDNNLADNNGLYYTARSERIIEKKDGILAEVYIIKSTKNDLYKTLTYRDTEYGNVYYDKNDLDNYYNGHEFEPCELIELPTDKLCALSIVFVGNVPNLVVYMSCKREKIESKKAILDKSEWSLFGKTVITSKFDVKLTYHINFGSVTVNITEKEYKELIELANTGINRSHDLMVDNLLKDFNGKNSKK